MNDLAEINARLAHIEEMLERIAATPGQPLASEREYIAQNILGGPEWAVADNKRRRLQRARKSKKETS